MIDFTILRGVLMLCQNLGSLPTVTENGIMNGNATFKSEEYMNGRSNTLSQEWHNGYLKGKTILM